MAGSPQFLAGPRQWAGWRVEAGRASRHSPHFPSRDWHRTPPELCRGEGAGWTASLQGAARDPRRVRRSQEGASGGAQGEGFPVSSAMSTSILWERKLRPRKGNRFQHPPTRTLSHSAETKTPARVTPGPELPGLGLASQHHVKDGGLWMAGLAQRGQCRAWGRNSPRGWSRSG